MIYAAILMRTVKMIIMTINFVVKTSIKEALYENLNDVNKLASSKLR